MDLSGCFWGVGERGQAGTESQGNSNPPWVSADLGLGWESGKPRGGSWKHRPETSFAEWIRELLVPCTAGKYCCCWQLLRIKLLHATWTDAQQGTALPQASISHMVLHGQGEPLMANSQHILCPVPCRFKSLPTSRPFPRGPGEGTPSESYRKEQ